MTTMASPGHDMQDESNVKHLPECRSSYLIISDVLTCKEMTIYGLNQPECLYSDTTVQQQQQQQQQQQLEVFIPSAVIGDKVAMSCCLTGFMQ